MVRYQVRETGGTPGSVCRFIEIFHFMKDRRQKPRVPYGGAPGHRVSSIPRYWIT